jgi:hypothetical protein
MFNEVRVFDPVGNLKNVVSSKSLSRRHWNDFNESEKDMSFNKAWPAPRKLIHLLC